jgi:hypothetical protein
MGRGGFLRVCAKIDAIAQGRDIFPFKNLNQMTELLNISIISIFPGFLQKERDKENLFQLK